MLNQEGTKKGPSNMVIDSWTPDELDIIAAELKQRFPTKRYGNMYNLEFTANEVEEAAEAVLPQHRHKSVSDYLDIRRPMFDAFTRITQPAGKRPALAIVPGPILDDGKIRWSSQEWEAVILELHQVCPKAFEERLKNLTIAQVRQAMEILAISRRRQFKQIVGFREQALRTWDDLPIEVRDPSKQVRAIIDFESGPVMAPPVTSKTKEHPMAAAIQKAFVQAEVTNEKKERKAPVHWKPEEWMTIAREMHRQNPHANYFISGFFSIDLPAVRDAQRVLPTDRRRGLTLTAGMQKPLVEAFKTLAIEMAEEENAKRDAGKMVKTADVEDSKLHKSRLDNAAAGRAKLAAMSPEERAEVARKGWASRQANKAKLAEAVAPVDPTIAPAAPVLAAEETPIAVGSQAKETAFVPLAARDMDFFGKVLNAALPLMNVLVDEAVSRLAPKLIAGMLPQFEKSLDRMIHNAMASQMPKIVEYAARQTAPETLAASVPYSGPVGPIVSIPEAILTVSGQAQDTQEQPKRLSKAELAQYLPQPVEKTKKPKIALLMPAGSQREQMRTSFPEYEFIFIDHGKGIKEAAQVCSLFVAVDAYVNIGNRKNIREYVPVEKLKYVDGGISSIKRQINIWKAQQAK